MSNENNYVKVELDSMKLIGNIMAEQLSVDDTLQKVMSEIYALFTEAGVVNSPEAARNQSRVIHDIFEAMYDMEERPRESYNLLRDVSTRLQLDMGAVPKSGGYANMLNAGFCLPVISANCTAQAMQIMQSLSGSERKAAMLELAKSDINSVRYLGEMNRGNGVHDLVFIDPTIDLVSRGATILRFENSRLTPLVTHESNMLVLVPSQGVNYMMVHTGASAGCQFMDTAGRAAGAGVLQQPEEMSEAMALQTIPEAQALSYAEAHEIAGGQCGGCNVSCSSTPSTNVSGAAATEVSAHVQPMQSRG